MYRWPRVLLVIASLVPIAFSGCSRPKDERAREKGDSGSAKKLRICLLPKKKGSPYFTSCAAGAKQAADELGNVELIYDGPTDGAAVKAADMVDNWALQKVDVICVSASNPTVLARAMRKAAAKGVGILTWDADTPADAREFFVNQATEQEIGYALVDALAGDIGGQPPAGEVAIVAADPSASNQNAWMKHMKARLAEKYPKLKLVDVKFPGEDQKKAQQQTRDLLAAWPNLKGIWGISSVSFPAAAEAVLQGGWAGKVYVTGLSTPNVMKKYVVPADPNQPAVVKSVVLWSTEDLGYLTIRAAAALVGGTLKKGDKTFDAGRLGTKQIVGDNILLGKILVFTKDNIEDFDF